MSVVEAIKFKIASLNSKINRVGEVVFGHNYIPQSENGESMLDAMIQRDQNIDLRNLQSEALANNPVLQSLGLKGHPAVKALGYAAGEQIGDKLSPLLGGNPATAVRSLHEGLNNPNVMRSFRKQTPANLDEKNEAMKALVNQFHRSSPSEADGNAKTSSEKLIGGEGDNKPDKLFNKKELAKGLKHETEHTKDKSIAKEIAKDHLSERSDYYSALARAKIE